MHSYVTAAPEFSLAIRTISAAVCPHFKLYAKGHRAKLRN